MSYGMKKGRVVLDEPKGSVIVAKGKDPKTMMFGSAMAIESTTESEGTLKRIARVCNHDPLRPILNLTICPSSTGAREPISVVIPFDLLRKKEAMMQKAIVSFGKAMDKTVRRRRLPWVRRLRMLNRERAVCGAVLMLLERKKKVMKKQRRGKEKNVKGKRTFVTRIGV
jgi:hypothetical protein